MTAVSRAYLPRGALAGGAKALPPPWAVPRAAFIALCDRCARCAGACPQGVVVTGRGGYPAIDFASAVCTFCAKFIESCPTGALSPSALEAGAPPWAVMARIKDNCLVQSGIDCRVCADSCDERAIRLTPAIGGPPRPAIRADDCTGCGACVSVCPAGAIEIRGEA